MRSLRRRIEVLEARRCLRSRWDYSRLTDAEVNELVELYLNRIEHGPLPDPAQRRFDQLDKLIDRRGLPPYAGLSDEELDRRIAAIDPHAAAVIARMRLGTVDQSST